MARGKTAQVRRGEARLYLEKAVQFIEQARSSSGLQASSFQPWPGLEAHWRHPVVDRHISPEQGLEP